MITALLEPLVIPTYPVGTPEKNPVYFEKRVYQGSCGKVYPVPFIDKVFDEPVPVTWQSARLENEFVRLVMLPEIGGRILIGQDKANADYDFFYRQDVIKPALVGLAGPWISGGVEFNWPQHHRPGTFLPADVSIEEEPDGARTVWMSEHDPLNRLKGMHGIRLRPGSSLIELRARLYNRTPLTQSFLWWANVAAMVHEQYQSFFPPDVNYVADHAVRAMSSFPAARNPYYGVLYQDRPGANDLTCYRNIPVPTSYMVCQTVFDFFGGFDFAAKGGFVHVADRHIAPGKKQWTWGNHPFGWAWDRELTDANGPYIELMAGVYTDNQPDFSYLHPFETKTFSQFWWPIQQIGPVQNANTKAALRMVVEDDRTIDLGICTSEPIAAAEVVLVRGGEVLFARTVDLAPDKPWQDRSLRFEGESPVELELRLHDATGRVILAFRPVDLTTSTRARSVATEPPTPQETASADELFFTGEHLEQYRHPTRDPEDCWNEALRRDPGDARCHLALGKRLLRKGMLEKAAWHFEQSITRLTSRHPNPVTGESHYFLGLTRFYQHLQQWLPSPQWLGHSAPGRCPGILPGPQASLSSARSLLSKATWNYEWRSSSHYLLACLDCQESNWESALANLDASLATNRDHNKARVLQAAILRRLGRTDKARAVLDALLAIDPLDHWAGAELASLDNDWSGFLTRTRNDAQTILDLVFDYADAGLTDEARALLDLHHAHPVTPVAVPNPLERSQMTRYVVAWLDRDTQSLAAARAQSPDYFFPSRLHERIVLEWALAQPGPDPLAAFALGNCLYDLKRHEDAIAAWETAESQISNPESPISPIPTLHRNLGIAYWNVRRDGTRARAEYRKALDLDSADPRLVSEYDQLCAKLNDPLEQRLAFLGSKRDLVQQRDDATVALATLHNLLDRPADALALVTSRRFHPWEGGEGAVLRQYTTARILLGRHALDPGDAAAAHSHFTGAMDTPESLGEAYHLLQAKADVNYWIGRSLAALGQADDAARHFEMSASEAGDFSEMAVTAHSPLSYFRGLSLRELGREAQARTVFADLKSFAEAKLGESAKIDYFATSLPNLLVFEEDLQSRRDAENHLLIALACHGLGESTSAREHLAKVLTFTNTDQRAADLARELPATP